MELAPIAGPKPIMRLGRDEYSGLHRRYAGLLGNTLLLKQDNNIPEHQLRELLQRFRNMMRALFNEKGASLRIEILAEKPAQDFIRTHTDTLDSAFRQVGMSHTMRQQLSRSNYVFSGLKTFHELNEAFPSLLDENGNRKTFERFLKDVQKIHETYNRNYLRAEYNFVHASAAMAARWEEFARDGDDYLLQYRTAGDGKVRPEHAALNGVTLPPSDTFWDEYYPPNGWNCRCTAVQVRKGKYPETPREQAIERGKEALAGDKKGMFRFNPGKQRKTVPDYNPYTTSRCRDCDIAKGKDRANEGKTKLAFSLPSAAGLRGSKAKLARKSIPDNELCAACRLIRKRAKTKEAIQLQRKEIKVWAKENLAGRTVSVQGIPHPIEFTMNGVKETLNQPHRYVRAKNEALRNILSLLQNGTHVLEKADDKGNPMVKKYHYIRIDVAGKSSFAVIRELTDGRCQFYSIVDKLRKKGSG